MAKQLIQITANYHDYTPPFAVEPIVRRMLDSVPDKYLLGLTEVVLTSTAGMSRARRRAVTKSRKRKVRVSEARGVYHRAWHNQPAWIEICVDNALKRWEKGWWLKLPWLGQIEISEVLFHEIGHHIHFTSQPEYREREDVADIWKARLQRNYYRGRHPWLRAITAPLRPLIRMFMRPMHRKMLNKGMISRAEFNELTNRSRDAL